MTPLARAFPLAAFVVLSACAGCGDDGGNDAGVDGPPDPCAPLMTFNGEYVAWDSGTSFMGIPKAVFALRSDPSIMHLTAPNGRFEMCIPPADGFVDVTPMAGSDIVGGTVVVQKDVLKFLPIQSYRSFTPTRAAEYGFSADQAQVFVHVAGGSRTVTTAANASVKKTFDGAAWVDGNTGTDIYLGNIDVEATTTLTITGGSVLGGGSIPLTAGAFTYVTLIAN
jgi:hypothetical protein